MALPANSDTRSSQQCFSTGPVNNHLKIETTAAINQGDFVISSPWCGVADQDIAANGQGTIDVTDHINIQTDDLKSGQDTFGTANAPVYFDNTAKEFSDTSTAGYFLVGYILPIGGVKDSNGVIEFEKTRYATVVV